MRTLALVPAILLSLAASARAQAPTPAGVPAAGPSELTLQVNGVQAPSLPETVHRGTDSQTSTESGAVADATQIDGRLDEPIYDAVRPISDFIQNEPVNGTPASERTEVWISFDDERIYVSLRAHESQPDRMVANEMRRDSFSILQNENFAFMFDTFFDRRSAVIFQFNPIGGRMDGQAASEGNYNGDWNPVWQLEVTRTPTGWTAEAAVPFRSLSYGPGRQQVWGFNARRINRWKNEVSYLTRFPDGTGDEGISYALYAAPLVGIEAPAQSRALDIKPYVIGDVTTDLPANVRNDPGGDFGVDLRYALTQNLTADFTYNTDFAQVEADEQQVNLTRFSLFFPEKRDFFLENQGLFNFGGVGGNGGGNNTPFLFYSRRIGLEGGQEVPILAGGRLTGRVGQYNVGLINMQTQDQEDRGIPTTNFAVARVRRDILRRSAVGVLFTRRSDTPGRLGSADAFGVDGLFRFFENLEFQTYWAKTRNPGIDGDDISTRTRMEYDGDRYGLTVDRVVVGAVFNPSVGFVRRRDMDRTFAQARFSPRPRNIEAIRQVQFQGQMQYIENRAGVVELREHEGQFQIEFENSDQFQLQFNTAYELVPDAFDIAEHVIVPAGEYMYEELRIAYSFGEQRPVSGQAYVVRGPFYGGTKLTYGYEEGRLNFHPQFAVEPGIEVNQVTLPYGDFTATLFSSRLTYTVTPLMFVSGLLQYNGENNALSTNVRLRWEYQPGSELFVVYNEGRDTLGRGLPDLQNRSFIVKVNRLFRF